MSIAWRLAIEKRIGEGKPWLNTYHLSDNLLADAQSSALSMVATERDIHSEFITFTRYILRPIAEGTGDFFITSLNVQGNRSISDELMPLFNTCVVEWNVLGGRPSRSYYRNLYEVDQGNAILTNTFKALVQTALEDAPQLLIDNNSLVDESGTVFSGWTIIPIVKMRSRTRRPKKKVVTPVVNPS